MLVPGFVTKNVLNKQKSWCASTRQTRTFYAQNHTNLLTTKIAFFFNRFFFYYWIRIMHDVFVADVIPCWANRSTYFFAKPSKMFKFCFFSYFARSESNGSRKEKNSLRCFYRYLLRTFLGVFLCAVQMSTRNSRSIYAETLLSHTVSWAAS